MLLCFALIYQLRQDYFEGLIQIATLTAKGLNVLLFTYIWTVTIGCLMASQITKVLQCDGFNLCASLESAYKKIVVFILIPLTHAHTHTDGFRGGLAMTV